MSGRRIHSGSTFVLSLLMAIIGVALIAQAVSAHGVFSVRSLLGVLFVAAGAARLYLERRRGRGT
ncbi:MAG TPA: hypothetical protein VGG98_05750 [Solirubrobacteraceae bacterium]|jgi:hypothetical protein